MRTKNIMLIYPENAYCVIFGEMEYPNMPSDAEETLEYIVETLTRREAEMFMLNYKDLMTYVEIGHKFKCDKWRVQQIIAKAIRKLRHPSRSEILSMGRKAYLNLAGAANQEAKTRYHQRISEGETLRQKQAEEITAPSDKMKDFRLCCSTS